MQSGTNERDGHKTAAVGFSQRAGMSSKFNRPKDVKTAPVAAKPNLDSELGFSSTSLASRPRCDEVVTVNIVVPPTPRRTFRAALMVPPAPMSSEGRLAMGL